MTTLLQASTLNVEATLNAWMRDALQAFSLPAWLSSVTVVYDAPQIAASLPCFSLIHIPVSVTDSFQGRWAGTTKGARASGVLDVSCWVSRSRSADWALQLRTMRDMVLSAALSSPVVIIQDYAGLASWSDTPAATAYKINLGDVTPTSTEADANPDVERARVLIDYHYIYRAS